MNAAADVVYRVTAQADLEHVFGVVTRPDFAGPRLERGRPDAVAAVDIVILPLVNFEVRHAALERNAVDTDVQAVCELEAVDAGGRSAGDAEVRISLLDLRPGAG